VRKRFVTVLAISDAPEDIRLLRGYLESMSAWRCDFLSCSSLEEALPLLAYRRVDVVLIDYPAAFPVGMAALGALMHRSDQLCRVVIVITEHGDDEVAVEAIKTGASDYIPKARLSPEVLYYAIRSGLEKAELRRQLEIQQEELVKLARCDELSGLFNRRAILERLDQEFARSKRYGSSLHLLMLDMDDFKSINDGYGHLAGDDLLEAVGGTIRSLIRSTDAAGRVGGDEFCLVVVEVKTEGVRILADRLLEAIRMLDMSVAHEKVPQVTCSIGIAAFTPGMASPRQLLDRADRALYEAKSAGRDRFSVLCAERPDKSH